MGARSSLIVLMPASESAQSHGIAWFEAEVQEGGAVASVIARDTGGREHSRLYTRLNGHRRIAFVLAGGGSEFAGEIAVSRRADDSPQVELFTGSERFVLPADDGASAPLRLAEGAARLLEAWRDSDEPLRMASVAAVAGDRVARYGCAPCVLIGGGILVGTGLCLSGAFAACAGALVAAGGFEENCVGACA